MKRNQRKIFVKKTLCGILTAAMLAGSLSDFTASAVTREAEQIQAGDAAAEAEQIQAGDAAAEAEQIQAGDAAAITGTQDGDGENPGESGEQPEDSFPAGVEILVEGDAVVEGLDDESRAMPGDEVSIQVIRPGYVLALKSVDEYGRIVYTAMPLNYDNRYIFTAEQAMEFTVVNPAEAGYDVRFAASRTADFEAAL